MNKRSGKFEFPVKGVVVGVGTSLMTAFAALWLAAVLILNGRVGEEQTGIIAYTILIISVLVGSIISAILSGKMGAAPVLSGSIFWMILFCIGLLFFDGVSNGVWISLLLTAVISGVVCATCMKKPARKGYKKLRAR